MQENPKGMATQTQEIAKRMRIAVPKRTVPAAPAVPQETQPAGESQEETLAERVMRQVVTRTVDEERLLPTIDKQRSTVRKKLDRMAEGKGWYVFAQNSAHAVATGKATQRRNAELALVQEGTRWRGEVQRYAPERAGEFDGALAAAMNDPKAPDHEGR